jgi:hypothetical protein
MNKPVHIVADIGGTNARFAYVQADSNELLGIEIFPCADFPFLRDAIRAYMERGHVDLIDEICLAVAGPVESDWIDLPIIIGLLVALNCNNLWMLPCLSLTTLVPKCLALIRCLEQI